VVTVVLRHITRRIPHESAIGKGEIVTATLIATRLASNGLQQHLYAEPTTVQEFCVPAGWPCSNDQQCCGDLVCAWLSRVCRAQ
jgi:hypothetical protein